jgi:uroporphyrinogen-III synthase
VSEYWHVLITGPVVGLESWVRAASEAGWRATALPLIEVEATGTPAFANGAPRPDWIAVTSSNALDALAAAGDSLAGLPLCCVGEATARRAAELGLGEARLPAPGAQDADGLASTLIDHAQPGQRVLWPRGDRARRFGERLEAAGLVVDAPVVYRTRAVDLQGDLPEADAVFFASPSAVEAWTAHEQRAAPAAIAIGWTTYDALERVADRFSMVLPLAQPSPASLQDCLRSFFPST